MFALNSSPQPLPNGQQKRIQLIGRTLADQQHAAVGQIANVSAHIKPAGKLLRRGAETNALHVATIMNDASLILNRFRHVKTRPRQTVAGNDRPPYTPPAQIARAIQCSIS